MRWLIWEYVKDSFATLAQREFWTKSHTEISSLEITWRLVRERVVLWFLWWQLLCNKAVGFLLLWKFVDQEFGRLLISGRRCDSRRRITATDSAKRRGGTWELPAVSGLVTLVTRLIIGDW